MRTGIVSARLAYYSRTVCKGDNATSKPPARIHLASLEESPPWICGSCKRRLCLRAFMTPFRVHTRKVIPTFFTFRQINESRARNNNRQPSLVVSFMPTNILEELEQIIIIPPTERIGHHHSSCFKGKNLPCSLLPSSSSRAIILMRRPLDKFNVSLTFLGNPEFHPSRNSLFVHPRHVSTREVDC